MTQHLSQLFTSRNILYIFCSGYQEVEFSQKVALNKLLLYLIFLQFQGILKPSYNSIDLTDVELMDDGRDPLDFNDKILEVLNYKLVFLNV